ncbi:Hypothetical predicted protein [Pelobates cultripes]|uniref:TNase-like domain-containing protein n=1 Tax=Pelobates cultripes TaxID=61616 RepID=A0AAD1RBX0_PELCU|nr:Hypothetical predicted protein [Pelobates cultripes]
MSPTCIMLEHPPANHWWRWITGQWALSCPHVMLLLAKKIWPNKIKRIPASWQCLDRKRLFSECINVEIVTQGLGKVAHVPKLDENPILWKFYKRLLQAEVKAQNKGKGLWKLDSRLDVLSNKMLNNSVVQKLNHLTTFIMNYWKKFRT